MSGVGTGDDAQPSAERRPVGDAEKAAIVSEIQRLYARLTPSATGVTMNAVSSIAIGAGAIAATRVPEAFITIPIFWTAWLFHSLILDLEALKDSSHLRWLEAIGNQILDVPIFVSETALTRRNQRARPAVFYASFCYTTLLTFGSWIAAIWIFVERGHRWWAVAIAVLAAAVVSVAGWTAARRPIYSRDYDSRLPPPEPGGAPPQPSDAGTLTPRGVIPGP